MLLAVAPVVSDLPLKTSRGMDSRSRINSSVRASRFVVMVSSWDGFGQDDQNAGIDEWAYREMNLNILVI